MKTKLFFTPLFACLLLTGCYKDINMEKYRPEPTLVLNSILSPDTIVMVQISQTAFFTDYRNGYPNISDAEVCLYVNGKQIEQMKYDASSQKYLSDYRPSPGDVIAIEANTSMGSVYGYDSIPTVIPIEQVTLSARIFDDPDQIIWTPDGAAYGKSYEANYHITFTDNPNIANFYFIRIESGDGLAAETMDYSYDDVFLAQQSPVDGITTDTGIYGNEGRTFTDELFNGTQYTMNIVERAPLFDNGEDPRPRKIILYSISESYYQYLTGIFNMDKESVSGNLMDWGFSEPSPHYTNITGGTGIIGAVQSQSAHVDLKTVLNPK